MDNKETKTMEPIPTVGIKSKVVRIKKERTPEQVQADKDRMAKVRSMKKITVKEVKTKV